MLRKLAKSFSPPYIAAIFESSAPIIRSQEFAEYKANRMETAHDILDQIPTVLLVLPPPNDLDATKTVAVAKEG
jgi:5'-3' exonuclease